MMEQLVEFTSNGKTFSRIATKPSDQGFIPDPGESALYYGGSNYFYSTRGGWFLDAYRTVDFGTEGQIVSDEFFAWFTANATKQED